jgi:hypothetical protein
MIGSVSARTALTSAIKERSCGAEVAGCRRIALTEAIAISGGECVPPLARGLLSLLNFGS